MRWIIADDWNISVDVAINPSLDAEPTVWDASLNFDRSITFSIWRLAASGEDNAAIYDEMRGATTWEDALPVAVPEASTGALLLGSLAGATLRRRTRRRDS